MAILHGGRLDEAIAKYGGNKNDWLDLSTGINPNPYPVSGFAPEFWQQLPQNQNIDALKDCARSAYGAPVTAACAAGAGVQAIIQNLPVLFKPQSVAIIGFTYQEHGLCWQQAGHDVLVADGLESAEATARIVIVVNPNNPDGRVIEPAQLVEIAKRLAARGGLLVVDEAYCDTMKDTSVISETGQAGLLVLRSFGKFFGLAGARLGFAFGPLPLIERLEETLGPWAVSGPAIAVGCDALQNKKWIKRARKRLWADRAAFEAKLSDADIEIVGATDHFVLIRHDYAKRLFEHFAKKQILTRPFPGREDWLRIGVPGKKPELNRLTRELAEFTQ